MANAIEMIGRCMIHQDPTITLPTGPETWSHLPDMPDSRDFLAPEEVVNSFTPID